MAFVAAVNDAGQASGIKAGDLVRTFAPVLGARGGGKADLAQGAGGDAVETRRRVRRGAHRTAPTGGMSESGEPTDPGALGDPGASAAEIAGIWFGVDVGTVRVGVARSDPRGVLAVPVTTLNRDPRRNSDIAELANLIAEYEAVGVVVGLPRTLAGREGRAAEMARAYGRALEEVVAPRTVHYVDERNTSITAARKLRQSGVRAREGRAVIDQMAAVELLQHWLELGRV